MMHYEIRVRGHLSPQWQDWFGGLTVTNHEQGHAVLTGWLPDKAALYGVLNQIQAVNLTLIAVIPLPDSPASESEDSPLGE